MSRDADIGSIILRCETVAQTCVLNRDSIGQADDLLEQISQAALAIKRRLAEVIVILASREEDFRESAGELREITVEGDIGSCGAMLELAIHYTQESLGAFAAASEVNDSTVDLLMSGIASVSAGKQNLSSVIETLRGWSVT